MSLDRPALAELAMRLAENFGSDSKLVELVARAARTGDEDVAAKAWDEIGKLPPDMRAAIANWLAGFQRGHGPANDR
jgi:predicted TPR repeat methyltransferase